MTSRTRGTYAVIIVATMPFFDCALVADRILGSAMDSCDPDDEADPRNTCGPWAVEIAEGCGSSRGLIGEKPNDVIVTCGELDEILNPAGASEDSECVPPGSEDPDTVIPCVAT